MEKLKPVVSKSSISSLKFQRKSDYKKFRNFIKKETKELKGIEAPDDSKVKGILKFKPLGLGIISLGLLFRAKGKSDGEGEGGKGKIFPFAIGRQNRPSLKPPPSGITVDRGPRKTPPEEGGKVSATRPARKARRIRKILKTRVTSNVDPQSKILAGKTKVTFSTTPDKAEIRASKNIVKRFNDAAAKTLKDNIKAGNDLLNKIKESKLGIKGADDIFMDIDGTFVDSFDKLSPEAQELAKKPSLNKTTKQIQSELSPVDKPKRGSTFKGKFKGGKFTFQTDTIRDQYNKLKRGFVKNVDLTERVSDVVSKNPFRRSPLLQSNFMKKYFGTNQKVTGDGTFFGRFSNTNILGKGRVSVLARTVIKNPLVKAGLFILDAYAAFRSGKQVFNLKDNLAFALYDLGVAINNEIFKNDPSKLKLYKNESSDENIRVRQILRNQKIKKLKEQAQKTSGGNNVIVVPENQQNNQVSTNIPIKKGADKISFVPFEPVNSLGTDILLHKLNQ